MHWASGWWKCVLWTEGHFNVPTSRFSAEKEGMAKNVKLVDFGGCWAGSSLPMSLSLLPPLPLPSMPLILQLFTTTRRPQKFSLQLFNIFSSFIFSLAKGRTMHFVCLFEDCSCTRRKKRVFFFLYLLWPNRPRKQIMTRTRRRAMR